MRITKIPLIIVLLLATMPLCGQTEKKVFSIEDAVLYAKENNLDIKISRNDLELSKLKNNTSWNSISPTAEINGNISDDFENDKKDYSVTGSINMKLSANLATSIKGAQLDFESKQLAYTQTVRNVELTVRKKFYELLFENENLALQKRNLETAKTQYERNQEKFKSGQMSELDVMTSRVNYQQKTPDYEKAQVSFQNKMASFKQLLGMDIGQQLEIAGSLDDVLKIKKIYLDKVEVEAAPDVEIAKNAVESKKNSLLAARFSALGPSISAGYSYGKSRSDSNDEWQTSNKLSLGVRIPLDGWLPWSTGAVSAADSKQNLLNAEKNLEKILISVQVNKDNYVREINHGISLIDSLKANVELADETYDMTRTAYNYGKTDLQSLQRSSDSVMEAGVALKEQAYNLICSILDLENLLGLPFGTLGFDR